MLIFSSPKVSHHSQHPELADRCRLPHPMCVCLCVSEHIQHMCESFLMHAPHTSTTDRLGLSSHCFIRLSLWCERPRSPTDAVLGNETEWICALHTKEEALPLICCVFLVSFIHCPLPSVARSNSSQTSSTSATSVANSLLSSLLMRPAGNVFFLFVCLSLFFVVFFCQASNLQVIWGPECSRLI